MSDPLAADLGMIRGRLAQSAYAMQKMAPSADVARDLLAFIAAYDEREALLERIRGDGIRLIAAYDAQAARLAAALSVINHARRMGWADDGDAWVLQEELREAVVKFDRAGAAGAGEATDGA